MLIELNVGLQDPLFIISTKDEKCVKRIRGKSLKKKQSGKHTKCGEGKSRGEGKRGYANSSELNIPGNQINLRMNTHGCHFCTDFNGFNTVEYSLIPEFNLSIPTSGNCEDMLSTVWKYV